MKFSFISFLLVALFIATAAYFVLTTIFLSISLVVCFTVGVFGSAAISVAFEPVADTDAKAILPSNI